MNTITAVPAAMPPAWQRERPYESSGTGFAVALANGSSRVLTNAHVVEHASVLQVRRGDPSARRRSPRRAARASTPDTTGALEVSHSPRRPCRAPRASTLSAQVRRRGDSRKYEARVVALGPECDLALLQVKREGASEYHQT